MMPMDALLAVSNVEQKVIPLNLISALVYFRI